MDKVYRQLLDSFLVACSLAKDNGHSLHVTMANGVTVHIQTVGGEKYSYTISSKNANANIEQQRASAAVFRLQLQEFMDEFGTEKAAR